MKLILPVISAAMLSGCLFGADVDGKWECSVKGGDGVERPLVATLQSDGMKLSGTVNGMNGQPDIPIADGMNHGAMVMWSSTRKIGNGAEQQTVQFNYKGNIDGAQMKIEIIRADGKGAPMSCTAKKAK